MNERSWCSSTGQGSCDLSGYDAGFAKTSNYNFAGTGCDRSNRSFEIGRYRCANGIQRLDFNFEDLIDFFKNVDSRIWSGSVR